MKCLKLRIWAVFLLSGCWQQSLAWEILVTLIRLLSLKKGLDDYLSVNLWLPFANTKWNLSWAKNKLFTFLLAPKRGQSSAALCISVSSKKVGWVLSRSISIKMGAGTWPFIFLEEDEVHFSGQCFESQIGVLAFHLTLSWLPLKWLLLATSVVNWTVFSPRPTMQIFLIWI